MAPYQASEDGELILSVSPSFHEFSVDRGVEFSERITLTNEGSSALEISIAVEDADDTPSSYSAAPWVSVDTPGTTLLPSESKDVAFSVSVPSNARSGGKYTTVSFKATPIGSIRSVSGGFTGGAKLSVKVQAPVLMTVRGPDLTLEGRVERLVPILIGPGRVGFRGSIANLENVHFRVAGNLDVRDGSGVSVGRVTLEETVPILPGTRTEVRYGGFVDVGTGEHQAETTLQYGWTESQIEAAEVVPPAWASRETTFGASFDSSPRLVVSEVDLQSVGESGVRLVVVLENTGDVELAPAGLIGMRNAEGDPVANINVPGGSIVVEPGKRLVITYELAQEVGPGRYELFALYNYHGASTASSTASVRLGSGVTRVEVQGRERQDEGGSGSGGFCSSGSGASVTNGVAHIAGLLGPVLLAVVSGRRKRGRAKVGDRSEPLLDS